MAAGLSSFSAAALEKKLKDLNSSLQSIQGVSQWLVHYRRNAKTIISVWYKELQKGSSQLAICIIFILIIEPAKHTYYSPAEISFVFRAIFLLYMIFKYHTIHTVLN